MSNLNKQNEQKSNHVNYWKWAFISLLIVLAIGVVLLMRALQPVSPSENEPATSSVVDQTEEIEIKSALAKKDVEFILNRFLEVEMENSNTPYEIQLDDDVKLSSNVDLMGFTIPFVLTFEPYATEEGNLQLRAQSVELASLSLPVHAILAALGNQMEWPTFIQLDSEKQMISVDFKELRYYYPYGIELEKIDLENDEIQLKLYINKDTLKRALDSEMNESSLIE